MIFGLWKEESKNEIMNKHKRQRKIKYEFLNKTVVYTCSTILYCLCIGLQCMRYIPRSTFLLSCRHLNMKCSCPLTVHFLQVPLYLPIIHTYMKV